MLLAWMPRPLWLRSSQSPESGLNPVTLALQPPRLTRLSGRCRPGRRGLIFHSSCLWTRLQAPSFGQVSSE